MDGPLGKSEEGDEQAMWRPQEKSVEAKKSTATGGSSCMIKYQQYLLLPAWSPEVFEFVTLVAVETGSATLA